jgi:hypothetical protein
MPSTLSTASEILKEVYEPKIRKQLNSDRVLLDYIKKTSDNIDRVNGKYCVFAIHISRNSGIGARREMENLPTPGNQGTKAARVALKYLYGGVQLSGQTIRLVQKDYQSFASALDVEVEGLTDDLLKDQQRQLYGNGSGALGATSTVGATVAGANVVITSGIQNFQIGEIVDVYTPANLAADSTAKATAAKITNITDNGDGTGIITTDAASITYAAGDIFVRTGNANREWTGLGAIVNNSGILYNIDPASFPIWKSTVDANGGVGRPVSENLIMKNVHKVRTLGASVDLMVSSLGVQRSYAALLQQQRQFVNTKTFTGGWGGIGFVTDKGEIPMIGDVDAPNGTIYGLSTKNLKIYRDEDWGWMDYDGNKWDRVTGKDAYAAMMFQYSELGTDRRNAHFVMRDLNES